MKEIEKIKEIEKMKNSNAYVNKNQTHTDTNSLLHAYEAINTEEKELQLAHTHMDENGLCHAHTHTDKSELQFAHTHEDGHIHGGVHPHIHSHEHTKAVINRLARAIGHMEAIKRMVEDGRDCSEVLIQLSAVRSAINNTSKVILEDHISHCIVDAVESGDQKVLEDLYKAIGYFMK